MMIHISSGPYFHRDSESEVRTLKFQQWHMIWSYLYFGPILGEIRSPPIMVIYIYSWLDFCRDSESKVRNLQIHQWNPHLTHFCSIYSRFKKGLGYIHRSHRYNHMSVMQHTCVYQYIINGSIYLQYLSLPTQKRQLSYMYHQSSNWVSDNITEGL